MNQMRKKTINRRGVTLVELVVTMAIIGIIVGMVFASDLWESRNRKQVQAEAQQLIAVIKEAQNNALTGKAMEEGEFPCSFQVNTMPESDPSQYQVLYRYRTNAGLDCDDNSPSKTYGSYNLKYGVQFGGESLIIYNIPFAASGSGAGSITSIRLQRGEIQEYVCVCGTGKVVEKGSPCGSYDSECKA